MKGTTIVWFRNDLRIHDHESLTQAVESGGEVIPVYIFDPAFLGKTRNFGFPRMQAFRGRFLLEALRDLKKSLQNLGADLLIRWGNPVEVLPVLAKETGARAVHLHRETGTEEAKLEEAVETALEKNGVEFVPFWGATLYHLADLPFPVLHLPDVFTQFRKQVEKLSSVRAIIPSPKSLNSLPDKLKIGTIPQPDQLCEEILPTDERSVLKFEGGETAGLKRLQNYFFEEDLLKNYKNTRNGLLGGNYSSKFSPWLALGCLSPRKIAAEVLRYESERTKNRSTYWMLFELIWRDFFHFWVMRWEEKAFWLAGITDWSDVPDSRDWDKFELWSKGETGIPFVDANMRELLKTGFMSNRGRQNVASYLVRDLGLDWRMGAEWFESLLIDYDVCSNYGNWAYAAGVGADPRKDRYFNVLSQAERYDRKGDYVRHWIPELSGIENGRVHEVFTIPEHERLAMGINLGVNYPKPIALPRGYFGKLFV